MPDEDAPKTVQRPVEMTPSQAGIVWQLLCTGKFGGRDTVLDVADLLRAIEEATEPLGNDDGQ